MSSLRRRRWRVRRLFVGWVGIEPTSRGLRDRCKDQHLLPTRSEAGHVGVLALERGVRREANHLKRMLARADGRSSEQRTVPTVIDPKVRRRARLGEPSGSCSSLGERETRARTKMIRLVPCASAILLGRWRDPHQVPPPLHLLGCFCFAAARILRLLAASLLIAVPLPFRPPLWNRTRTSRASAERADQLRKRGMYALRVRPCSLVRARSIAQRDFHRHQLFSCQRATRVRRAHLGR